jgi:hypothetical protein
MNLIAKHAFCWHRRNDIHVLLDVRLSKQKGIPAQTLPALPLTLPESAWAEWAAQPFQVFAPTMFASARQRSKPRTRLTNANSIDADHANCHSSGQNPTVANTAACIGFFAIGRIRGGQAARVTCCSGRSCRRLHLASNGLDFRWYDPVLAKPVHGLFL